MHKALSQKSIEEALRYAMFQMEMYNVLIQRPEVLKHNRSDGCLFTPFPDLLVLMARKPQSIQRIDPSRVRSSSFVECRELPALHVWATFVRAGNRFQRSRTK